MKKSAFLTARMSLLIPSPEKRIDKTNISNIWVFFRNGATAGGGKGMRKDGGSDYNYNYDGYYDDDYNYDGYYDDDYY